MTDWQPIETAPRDGTEFQAWIPDWDGEEWRPKCKLDGENRLQEWGLVGYDFEFGWVPTVFRATHWAPHPKPPEDV